MKKLFSFVVIVSLAVVSIFTHTPKVEASENKGITIYPAFIELSVGESYSLNVQNNSNQQETINIIPELFSIDSEKETIVPISAELLDDQNIELSNSIQLSESELVLESGETKTIEINYIEKVENYIPGVKIVRQSGTGSAVAIGYNLASIVLDLDLSEEDLEKISQEITVDSSFNIGNFHFGRNFKITFKLKNGTSNIIKAFGEILIKDENKRIEQFSLTTDLQKTIYPTKEVSITKDFSDSRSFSERIGTLNIDSFSNVNNREIEFSKSIYVLPIELLLIVVLILPSLLLLVFMYKKRTRLKRTGSKVKKARTSIKLGQRKN